MRVVLKVSTIKNQEDVCSVREAIASHEGVIACEINIGSKEAVIVYDDKSVSVDNIISSIEIAGHSVL